MSEAGIQRAIMAELGRGDGRVFRNNVGVLRDERGQFVRYGLCVGSSDLIGWRTVTVTPEMVGRQLAVFVAIEVKTERGRVTDEQQAFIAAVQKAGGLGGVARSIDDAKKIVCSGY
jgi:hypothetical protein